MSIELDSHHQSLNASYLETEVVSHEMITAAVNACVTSYDGSLSDRALELVTPEEIAACETDANDECEDAPEIETAEELSLKNGVYHEIRRKLGERFGIPPTEVAFIHDAETPAKKAALFKAVNGGRVRVLIGSTSKLGTGINVQQRLIALHHVDEPWKPAELEQREGRILRQGNIYPEAFIFHYVTERSFDGYMLQTLESKARFISQIMAGEVTARTAEDVGDMVLTVAQIKAIASGNPMVQQRIELEVKLVKLDRLRAAFYNNRAAMRADLEELPERIVVREAELAGHESAIKACLPLAEDSFSIKLRNNPESDETSIFDQRERAGAQLRYLAELLMDRFRRGANGTALTKDVGSYRGFQVSVHVSGNSRFAHHSTLFNHNVEILLRATETGTTYIAQLGESNVGITQSMDYQLRHLEDRVEQARSGLEMLHTRLTTVTSEVDKSWALASEYARLRRRYDEMGQTLQSQGIEIESNTTFTGEDDTSAEITGDADTGPTEEPHLAATDELAARGNPYTGLEDFAIFVEETSEPEFGDEGASSVDASVLAFDFEASGAATQDNGETFETDIFPDSPHTGACPIRSTGVDDANGKTAAASNDDAMWHIAEPTDQAISSHETPLSSHDIPLPAKPRAKQSSTAGTQSQTTQIGFLW
ncbi:MAG: helicase C-terminal domain-containing protein [Acidobacteriota bacterium]|nr:helicase C-terminal domain-containing protein [Acidobacteriota bacterium]